MDELLGFLLVVMFVGCLVTLVAGLLWVGLLMFALAAVVAVVSGLIAGFWEAHKERKQTK